MKLILQIIILAIALSATSLADIKVNGNENHKVAKAQLRDEYYMQQRAYPNDYIPEGAKENAWKQFDQMLHNTKDKRSKTLSSQNEWNIVGPFKVGGRVKSVVVHPQDPNIVYIAAATGGIWKTTNGGNEWFPLFDYKNSISMGSLAMDPEDSNILYAATGEAIRGASYAGDGVFKTVDGGNTWEQIGLTTVEKFSKIFVHPKNRNLIIAGGFGRGRGLYVSTDAGGSWERRFSSHSVTDVSINPNDENEIILGLDGAGVRYSNNQGASWTERNQGAFQVLSTGRTSVQASPSNFNILYALMEVSVFVGETNQIHGRIYKSTNKGISWFQVLDGGYDFFRDQGWYNNTITVHPTNPDICIAGGIDIWTTENGAFFTNQTRYYQGGTTIHPDQHATCFAPSISSTVYMGNDGGVYKSTNNGRNWFPVNNGLAITQFYDFDLDLRDRNVNYGGTQDNGTVSDVLSPDWNLIWGGDGFQCVVSRQNPNRVFIESQYGNVAIFDRLSGRANSFAQGLPPATAGNGLFNSPLAPDPNYGDIVYHGRKAVYISQNFSAWQELPDTRVNGLVSAIGSAYGDNFVLYFGTNDGELFSFSEDSFGNVERKALHRNGTVNRYVTHIETSWAEPATAYVTFSGYGAPQVFKTTNYGDSWKSLSSNLPDAPANYIIIHPTNPKNLFVANDVGVFTSFDDGDTWMPLGIGLPRAPVSALKFHTNLDVVPNYILRASTYGRSIWEIDIPEEFIVSPEITRPNGGEIMIGTTMERLSWVGFDGPVKVDFTLDDGANWWGIVESTLSNHLLWKVRSAETFSARIRVTSVNNPEIVRISNSFTITRMTKGAVINQNFLSVVPYGLAWADEENLWTTDFYGGMLHKFNPNTMQFGTSFKLRGDSLYTDLTVDKKSGDIYVHRLYSAGSVGIGGAIEVYDKDGNYKRQMNSPAKNYPIALEFIGDNLLVGDRDDKREFFIINPLTGSILETISNPCNSTLGPRSLCYDGSQYIYHICTDFPASAGLTLATAIKIPSSNISSETERIPLESSGGIINARGIEYDPRDKNLWVTDFSGNIFKIAGFETVTSVENDEAINSQYLNSLVYPNPMQETATFSFEPTQNANIRVELVDLLGNKVSTLYSGLALQGQPITALIRANNLSNGVYLIVLNQDGANISSERLIIAK